MGHVQEFFVCLPGRVTRRFCENGSVTPMPSRLINLLHSENTEAVDQIVPGLE